MATGSHQDERHRDPWRVRFRQRFAELKRARGLTQRKLGDQLQVGQSTIAHWLNGRRSPDSIEQFLQLEAALGLAPGDLLRDAPPDPDPARYVAALLDVRVIAQILRGLAQAEEQGVLPPSFEHQATVFAELYHRWVVEGVEPGEERRFSARR